MDSVGDGPGPLLEQSRSERAINGRSRLVDNHQSSTRSRSRSRSARSSRLVDVEMLKRISRNCESSSTLSTVYYGLS